VAPHSSSEICQPFFENAGTRPGQNIAQGEQAVLPGEREFPFFKGIFNIKGKKGIYLLNRDFL
jgi:hypothetical protein